MFAAMLLTPAHDVDDGERIPEDSRDCYHHISHQNEEWNSCETTILFREEQTHQTILAHFISALSSTLTLLSLSLPLIYSPLSCFVRVF